MYDDEIIKAVEFFEWAIWEKKLMYHEQSYWVWYKNFREERQFNLKLDTTNHYEIAMQTSVFLYMPFRIKILFFAWMGKVCHYLDVHARNVITWTDVEFFIFDLQYQHNFSFLLFMQHNWFYIFQTKEFWKFFLKFSRVFLKLL